MSDDDSVAIAKPCSVSLPLESLNGVAISAPKESLDSPLATADSSTPNHELVCGILPDF